jgi:uncharacterized damage-inducible protein DinB
MFPIQHSKGNVKQINKLMNVKEGIRQLTGQIQGLLDNMDDNLYKKPLEVYNGSSIGQHVRHIFDFYRCLSKGIAGGIIDYADRQRDVNIEVNPSFAANAFEKELQYLLTLDEMQFVAVRGDYFIDPEASRPEYASSVGRELTFLHDHAIHHLAMIRIGLEQEKPHLIQNKHFGVAPSTVKYKNN